MSKTKYAIK